MFTHAPSTCATPVRRARRRAVGVAVLTGVPGLLLAASALPAAADTPAAWTEVPDVSVLGFLLVLVILPVGLAVVITLLSLLPSLAGDKGYEHGAGWRGEPEWFGAPTKGLSAAEGVTAEQLEASRTGSGGTSAGW